MIHTDWTANPIVFSHGGEAFTSCAANQAKPVSTMIWPSRFSGRARHEASPQPSSEAPTSSSSTGPGSVGRPGGWCAASQTAPAPASTPARRPRTALPSLERILAPTGRGQPSSSRVRRSLGRDRRQHVELGGAARGPGRGAGRGARTGPGTRSGWQTGMAMLVTPLLRSEDANARPSAVPMTMPMTAPNRAMITASERIICRTCRRFIPTARSRPISCVRSNTDSISVLTIPISATRTASASRT